MIIEQDLPCGRCGYNLHTLSMESLCPECGVPVARSADGETLVLANRPWRIKQALGLVGISAGVAIWIALQAIVGQGYSFGSSTPYIVLLALIFQAAGMWIFTSPEPDPLKLETPLSRRRILRLGWSVVWLMYVASPLLGIRDTIFTPGLSGGKFFILLTLLLATAMFCLLGLHLAALMRRAGDRPLSWIWTITAGAGVVGGLILTTPVAARFLAQIDAATAEVTTVMMLAFGFAIITSLAGLLGYSAFIVWRAGKSKNQP